MALRSPMALLTVGTLLSQFLIFSSTIFMGHLYSPSQFGFYALIVSLASIIALTLSRSLETFIVPAKSVVEAEAIYVTSIRLVFRQWLFMMVFLIVVLFAFEIAGASKLTSVVTILFSLILAPLLALYSLSYQLILRSQNYGVLATRGPLQNSAIGVNQWILHHSYFQNFGLVLGEMLGRIVSLTFLFVNVRTISRKLPQKIFKSHGVQKIDKPIVVNLISIAFDLAAASALLIYVNLNFGESLAGQLSMAQKIAVVPIVFLGANLAQYFLSSSSDSHRKGFSMSRTSLDSLILKLMLISITIGAIFFFLGPIILRTFLGPEWVDSEQMIKFLLPGMVVSFIWNPLSSYFYVRNLWAEFLKVSTLRFFFMCLSGLLAKLAQCNVHEAIVLITMANAVIQVYGLHVLRKDFR